MSCDDDLGVGICTARISECAVVNLHVAGIDNSMRVPLHINVS